MNQDELCLQMSSLKRYINSKTSNIQKTVDSIEKKINNINSAFVKICKITETQEKKMDSGSMHICSRPSSNRPRPTPLADVLRQLSVAAGTQVTCDFEFETHLSEWGN